MAMSLDLSQTNHCLAFGDQHSGISLYTAAGKLNLEKNRKNNNTGWHFGIHLFTFYSIYCDYLFISVYLYFYLSLHLNIHLSIYPSIYPSIYLGEENPTFNVYPRDTEFPHPLPTFPAMRIEDEMANYATIPLPHLPPDQTKYVSDNWPER